MNYKLILTYECSNTKIFKELAIIITPDMKQIDYIDDRLIVKITCTECGLQHEFVLGFWNPDLYH